MHKHTSTTIDRALANNVRIDDAMVAASATLREVAIDFVRNYRGRNEFVQNVAVFLADRGGLSNAQMRGALNVMIAEAKAARADAAALARSRQRASDYYTANPGAAAFEAAAAGVNAAGGVFLDLRSAHDHNIDAAFGDGAAAQARIDRALENVAVDASDYEARGDVHAPADIRAAATVSPRVPDGFYTVMLGGAEYRTLRVETADTARWRNIAPGTQIISFLSGPNNETAYTGFAFLAGDRVSIWRKFNTADALRDAAAKLVAGFEDAAAEYVKRSSRCFICQRPLSTPESIAAGIGPICRQNIGAAGIEFDFARLAAAVRAPSAEQTETGFAREAARIAARAAAQRDIDELFPDR